MKWLILPAYQADTSVPIHLEVAPPLIAKLMGHMGPIWGQQDPGGPHVGPMNLAIWVTLEVQSVHLLGIYMN